ncbi:MAG: DEAD/DEAH box helicase, partial [Athalassotoga sp.]
NMKKRKKADKDVIKSVATGFNDESTFKVIELSELYDFFGSISMVVNENDSTYSAFFKRVFVFAQKLVSNGLIMPKISKINEKGDFKIDFVPAFSQTEFVNYLSSIAPKDIVINDEEKVLRRDMIGNYVTTLMINEIVKSRSEHLKKFNDKLINAFFFGEIYRAEKFEEKQTFVTISNWLSVLDVHSGKYTLVVGISKEEDNFDLKLFVESKGDPLELPIEFDEFLKMGNVEDERARIFKQLGIIAKYSPLVAQASRTGEVENLKIEDLKDFIINGQHVLRSLGVEILLPKELKKIWKPELALSALTKNKKDHVRSYLTLDSIFELRWKIKVGNKELSPEELANLYNKTKGIVALKDMYVFIDPDEMRAIIEKVQTDPSPSSNVEALRLLFSKERWGVKIEFDDNLKKFLDDFKKLSSIRPPKFLKGVLREYQIRGFQWLYSNTEKGLGVCLADDMGLGKTVQVISVILKKIETGTLNAPALVICPTTLIGNWKNEIEKFAPSIKASIYHGTDRVLNVDESDIVITSYGVARSDTNKLKSVKWSYVIIDEAQNIKNSATLQSLSVKSIEANSKIALTGTPIENRLTELWSIYDFLMPEYLGKKEWFIKTYSVPIEKDGNEGKIDELKRIVSPFMMRRMKTDKNIIKDLPDKIIVDDHVELKAEQAALYKLVTKNEMKKLYDADDEASRNGAIFRILTALKQICNHPVHYAKHGTPKIESSGKAERMIEILEDILDVNEKAVIFTQYKEMGDLLVEMIYTKFGIAPLFFNGELSRTKRDLMVNEFQTKHSKPFMILTIKAGGTGLNLTAANHVIHYDLWWNPAVEDQGTDRTFRIGQDKNVIVHRLITSGTLEEKIDKMLREKRKISGSVIAAGEKWIGDLSNDELKDLFKLD